MSEETSLCVRSEAISLVPSGTEMRAGKLQAVVASERAAEWHGSFPGKVERAASRQVRRCIRLRSERKQIAEKVHFQAVWAKHEKWN